MPPSPTPDPREYSVNIPVAQVWDAPENEDQYWHLQTELLMGERVLVLEQTGEWARIAAVDQPSGKDPLGYPGWVRFEALHQGWENADQYAIVMVPQSPLRAEPGGEALLNLSLDLRLPVVITDEDWVQVRLPDGRTGWLSQADVRLIENLSQPIPAAALFALAERLIGQPYKWGGTTSAAPDCSGLTYRLFHAYGILIGRDAGDQAGYGEPTTQDELRKGDLVFTSDTSGGTITHVAMYWGEGKILDSSGNAGVTIRPLLELLRVNTWVTARMVFPKYPE
jgi:gamma-D-glutamyl-L-lysine dipeptidyl-peptidase